MVGPDAEELASSSMSIDSSPLRLVPIDLLTWGRSVAPSAIAGLPSEVLDASGLPPGPALIAVVSAGERDFGILALVRAPGDPEFDLEEATCAQAFATRAAAMVAHLQALGTREARAVQNDRVRIAANLHDLVIQSLFGVGLRLQSLSTRIDSTEVAGDLENCVGQIDETILAVRRSIFALRQPVTDQLGLRSRILNVASAAPFGFEPTIHFNGPIDSAIPDSVHDDLLISLGEILANAMRHAGATAVDIAVSVDLEARVAELCVTDNGVGWKGEPRDGHGTGNLLRRAVALGGSCSFTAPLGKGTEVRWRASLNHVGDPSPVA